MMQSRGEIIFKKKLLIVTVLMVFLVLTGSFVFATTYDDVIKVIDEWLDSIPKDSYKVVEGDRAFQFRVAIDKVLRIEELGPWRELFPEYEKLREEFLDLEIEFRGYLWNEKTILFRQLHRTTFPYNIPIPRSVTSYLEEIFEYATNNLPNDLELWYWNYYLLLLVSIYPKETFMDAADLIDEALKLFVALSPKIARRTSPFVMIPYNFAEIYSTHKMFGDTPTVQEMLWILEELSNKCRAYLSEEQKQIILNFVLPKYQEYDETIRIYNTLTN